MGLARLLCTVNTKESSNAIYISIFVSSAGVVLGMKNIKIKYVYKSTYTHSNYLSAHPHLHALAPCLNV